MQGPVLEVGVGTGLNFPHYAPGARVVALEPDPYMLHRARRRAASSRNQVMLVQAEAEHLPFGGQAFEGAVVTLVLCSVSDLDQALTELRRVLRPGGAVRFVEHVRGEGWLGRMQDLVTPIWRRVGAGCEPNRRTEAAIRRAGFEVGDVEHRSAGLTPLVIGSATRPA